MHEHRVTIQLKTPHDARAVVATLKSIFRGDLEFVKVFRNTKPEAEWSRREEQRRERGEGD